LNVYRSFGAGFGGLGFMGCTFGGSTTVTADAGTTCYLQVGTSFGGGGSMTLDVAQIPPPAHDDFANAIEVGGLPFVDSSDLTAATTQAGEPLTPGGLPQVAGSVWYTYTATGPEPLTASTSFCCTYSVLAIYTGDAVTSLSEVVSRFAQPVTFRPTPGTTYYIQVGRGTSFGSNVPMSFRLELTPPPVVNFGWFSSEPSTFDLTHFQDFSFDPGQAGIESQAWDFGDGATATGCCPSRSSSSRACRGRSTASSWWERSPSSRR
jgi:hypothetical protein